MQAILGSGLNAPLEGFMIRSLRTYAVCVAACFLSCAAVLAQTAGTATLVGNVTDSSGAIITTAKVSVVNPETATSTETLTTPEGTYYVPYLAPGTYRVVVEAPGFKRYQRDGLVLRVGETPRVDVQLEVGAV